jgi:hypothetical protein
VLSLGENHVGVHILGIQLTHELAAASATTWAKLVRERG